MTSRRLIPGMALFLVACIEPGDAGDPFDPSLGARDYVLEGTATFETTSGGPVEHSETFALFTDADGVPEYLYDPLYDRVYPLTFGSDAARSDDVCEGTGCAIHVERTTGCAEVTYGTFFYVPPGTDTGYQLTGSLRACPTAEPYVRELVVRGDLQQDTLLPSGGLSIVGNYPIAADVEHLRVAIDGEPVDVSFVTRDGFRYGTGLGPLVIGTDVVITYDGPNPPARMPTALATTATLTDLTLETAPPEGALDARGYPLVYDAASLFLEDEGRYGRSPFVVALALGAPGGSVLVVEAAVDTSREGGATYAQLIRASGEISARVTLLTGEVPVPAGTGDVWLLLTNDQQVIIPNDRTDPEVFRLSELSWR